MTLLDFFVGITRDHIELEKIDSRRVVAAERYSCLNCHSVGGLDAHGRCEACGSDSVQPWEVFNYKEVI